MPTPLVDGRQNQDMPIIASHEVEHPHPLIAAKRSRFVLLPCPSPNDSTNRDPLTHSFSILENRASNNLQSFLQEIGMDEKIASCKESRTSEPSNAFAVTSERRARTLLFLRLHFCKAKSNRRLNSGRLQTLAQHARPFVCYQRPRVSAFN